MNHKDGDFEKLQNAILEYFNDYEVHPYANSSIENIARLAKIRFNGYGNKWERIEEK